MPQTHNRGFCCPLWSTRRVTLAAPVQNASSASAPYPKSRLDGLDSTQTHLAARQGKSPQPPPPGIRLLGTTPASAPAAGKAKNKGAARVGFVKPLRETLGLKPRLRPQGPNLQKGCGAAATAEPRPLSSSANRNSELKNHPTPGDWRGSSRQHLSSYKLRAEPDRASTAGLEQTRARGRRLLPALADVTEASPYGSGSSHELLPLFTQYKVHHHVVIELTDFLPGPFNSETEVRASIANSLERKNRGSD